MKYNKLIGILILLIALAFIIQPAFAENSTEFNSTVQNTKITNMNLELNSSNNGISNYDGPNTNTSKWISNVSTDYNVAIGLNNTVYVSGNDGKLYALDGNGKVLWTYATSSKISGSPNVDKEGNVYFTNWMNSSLYKLTYNGTLLWKYNLGDYNSGTFPVLFNESIFVTTTTSDSSKLFSLTPQGELNWICHIHSPNYGSSPTIASDGTIFIVPYNFRLYAVDSNGSIKWSKIVGSSLSGEEILGSKFVTVSIDDDGTLYLGNHNVYRTEISPNNYRYDYGKWVIAYNQDGSEKWHALLGEDKNTDELLHGSVSVSKDGILYALGDCRIFALNSTNGVILWSYEIGQVLNNFPVSPVITDDTIYLGSSKGVYALDKDGNLKWFYKLPNVISSPVMSSDNTLYISNSSGLFAFNDYIADFSVSPVQGTNLSSQFKDTSNVNAVSWHWDFGDNSTSTEKNPIHTYSHDDLFEVVLTITLDDGSTLQKNKVITVKLYDLIKPVVSSNLKGGEFYKSVLVILNATDNREVPKIYYTTDSTNPINSLTRKLYTEPLLIEVPTNLKFSAVDSSNNWANVLTEFYNITDVLYVQDASKYNSLTMNKDIQTLLDNADASSKVAFLGREYKNLNLIIKKPLNLISTVNTKIISSTDNPVFLINGITASGTTIKGFEIINDKESAIVVNGADDVKLISVKLSSANNSAIQIVNSKNTVLNKSIIGDSLNGVYIDSSYNTLISNSSIKDNKENGVVIYKSDKAALKDSTISNNGFPDITGLLKHQIMKLNTFKYGVFISESTGTLIESNKILNNGYGIVNSNIVDTKIIKNSIINNYWDGILLEDLSTNTYMSTNYITENNNGLRINGDYINLQFDNNVVVRNIERGSHYFSGDGLLFGEKSSGSTSVKMNHNLFLNNEHRSVETRYGQAPPHPTKVGWFYVPGTNLWENVEGYDGSCACTDIFTAQLELKLSRNGDNTYTLMLFDPVTGEYVTGLPNFDVNFKSHGNIQSSLFENGKAITTISSSNLVGSIEADVFGQKNSTKWDIQGTGFTKKVDSGYAPSPIYGQGTGTGTGSGGTGTNPGTGSNPNGIGTDGSGNTGSSSGSSTGNLPSVGDLDVASTTVVAASSALDGGSPSEGASDTSSGADAKASQDSKTLTEILSDENDLNMFGILAIILIFILLIAIYYREDIKDMFEK